VATPTRDVPTLLRIVRSSLEAHAPIDAVRGLRVTAVPRPVRPVQLGLFDPPGPAPERLALTLTKLTALVGNDRVGAPVAPDTHRPYAVAVATFDPPRAPRSAAPATEAIPMMALHVFRPPRDAEVLVEDGRIARVRAGEVQGAVRASGGPWRVDGQWWGEPFDHEGWDVELDDGGLYLVAFDRVAGRWHLDGVYE
jgi:protein ImuB